MSETKTPGPAELRYRIEAHLASKSASIEKKEAKALNDLLAEMTAAYESALKVKEAVSSKVPIVKSKGKGKAKSYSTACVLMSDWHCEETVTAARVNQLNEFNLEVAEQRIHELFERIVVLTAIQRMGTNIDTLVTFILGDLITGFIHEELLETNAFTPAEAVVWLAPRIRAGFDFLKKEGCFKRIIAPCCVGNHGRTTIKRRVKTQATNSFEWILYHMLAQSIDGVEWIIPKGLHTFVEIYDKTIRAHHGDAFSYQGGVGGITIPVNKGIAQWDKSRRVDLDVFGHWHQTIFGQKWICNGSLIGYNEFALQIKADFEPPQQSFFLMREHRGRTIHAPIFLN